jgi:hypothetical protein
VQTSDNGQGGDDDKHQNGREMVNTHTHQPECVYEDVTMSWDQRFTQRSYGK